MTTIVKGDGQKKGRQPEKPGGRDFVVVEQSRDKMAQHFTRIAKKKYQTFHLSVNLVCLL